MLPTPNDLEKLKTIFHDYRFFWDDWSIYKYNGLSETDIYVINVFIFKDFTFILDDMPMFYFKKEVIQKIIAKLKRGQKVFKRWIFGSFYPSLLKISIDYLLYNDKTYCYIIEDKNYNKGHTVFVESNVDEHKIKTDILKILKEFDFKTLNDLIVNFERNFYCKKHVFLNVSKLLNTSKKKVKFPFPGKMACYQLSPTPISV